MNLDVKRFGIRHKGMRNRTASCAWTLLELDCLLLCDTPDANASLLWIMSRALAGLSCYAGSDSDTDSSLDADKPTSKVQHAKHPSSDPANASGVKPEPAPDTPSIRKKRKLRPIEAESFLRQDQDVPLTASKADNPAKKLARGDWLCYCFVNVPVDHALSTIIRQSRNLLQEQLGPDHKLLDLSLSNDFETSAENTPGDFEHIPASDSPEHLHISLTRPFTVRSYERDEYVKIAAAELRRLKTSIRSFPFSFSRFAYLANDDASRHFMVLEVGAGHEKFHKLSTALSAELRRAFRAKSYYEEARFHASIACLPTPPSMLPRQAASPTSPDPRLGTQFDEHLVEVEQEWGPELRKCSPIQALRVGIQVANRITYVDL